MHFSMQKLRNISAAALSLFLLVGGAAHAQSLSSQPDPVQFTLSPETPGPNQLVNIEAAGVGTFLGNATITWQENGKTVLSGVGKNSYSFTTGGIGTQTRIRVVIESASQGVITRDFTFYPSLIHLVWEADTTVPRFYGGKALYSGGSRLRVVAFPLVMSGGALVPSSKLSFQWKQNATPAPQKSGLGANVFSFDGDQLHNAETASVDAYLGTTKVAHGEITIPASAPGIALYYRDALRGELLDAALPESISLGGKELTIQAEPYFFSKSSAQKGALKFSWTLNGQDTTGPDAAQGLLTLRQTGEGAGSAAVGVSVQNTESSKYVQAANAALTLLFGEQSGSSLSSFFGL